MCIKIAIFASGSGTNAENIVRYFSGKSSFQVALVVSNRPDAYVLERARRLGVPSVVCTNADFKEGGRVLSLLEERGIGFVVLAGFLLRVPDKLLQAYPERILNIHPALLPKFGGKGMYGDRVHEAVVAAGECETGITIHYINEYYDEGGIVFQAACPVAPEDSPRDVAAKVHALEYKYYPVVIEDVLMRSFPQAGEGFSGVGQ